MTGSVIGFCIGIAFGFLSGFCIDCALGGDMDDEGTGY